ncbi:MAG TPA: hypothetical protein PKE63_11160, partial [Lacibacter sp.]|nr:hypothetical protein [Lacibacter sp.]
YDNILQALSRFDPDAADSEYRVLQELEQYGIKLRSQSIRYIKNLTVNDTRSAQVLLYSSDLMEDLLSSLVKLGEECRHYIHNLHEEPHADFVRISEELRFKMQAFLQLVVRTVEVADFENLQKVKTVRDDARNFINDQLDRCMRSIQHDKPATRYAVLQTTVLLQSRDILAVTLRIFQLYRKYEKL